MINIPNIVEYEEIIAFHPGCYLADVMNSLNYNSKDMAENLNLSVELLNKLLNGEADIDEVTAEKIAALIGTSSKIWLNLQKDYDDAIYKIIKEKEKHN